VLERAKTVRALDRAVIAIGNDQFHPELQIAVPSVDFYRYLKENVLLPNCNQQMTVTDTREDLPSCGVLGD
jgi:hypothetical protein